MEIVNENTFCEKGVFAIRFLAAFFGRVSMLSSICGHAGVEYDIPWRDLEFHDGK